MRAQLATLCDELSKLKEKFATFFPPIASDALMQLFSTSPETTRLDKVWSIVLASEPNQKGKGKKRLDRSSPPADTPKDEMKRL